MEVKRPIVCALFFGFAFLITMIVLITYFSTKRSSTSSALRSPVNDSSRTTLPYYPYRPRPTTPRDYEQFTPSSRRPTQTTEESPARNDPIRYLSAEERQRFLSKYQDDPLYKDVTEMLHRQERRSSVCLHRGMLRIVEELVPATDLFYEALVPSQRVCLPTCNMSDGLHGKPCETVKTEPTEVAVYLYGNPNSVHPKTVPLSFEGDNLVVGYIVEVDAETVCRCVE